MNRAGNLWPRVVAWDNLWAAARDAARGKRWRASTLAFTDRLEDELASIRADLCAGRYVPGPYREFTIREPKPRWISAAPFRDRVVHHALCRVLAPVIDRTLIADTYACRAGKGTHAAVDRAQHWLRRSRWVLRLDVARFFPSIDHAILRGQLARLVKDRRVLALCGAILDGGPPPPVGPAAPIQHFAGDDLFTPLERRRGLPIGNLTSQWWANLYLSGLDHWIQERLRLGRVVRYMDDLLVFHDDRERLRAARAAILERLAGLRLRPHPHKCHLVPAAHGVPWLGFHLYPTHRRLLAEGKTRQRRRLRRQAVALAQGEITPAAVRASWAAWCGHARHGHTRHLRATLRREFRAHREAAMAN